MTKLMTTLTISAIVSILVIGALIASPDAYSSKNNDVLDECKCEKPHTLKVLFTVPDTELPVPENVSFKAEIFKKLDDKNNEEKQLGEEIILTPNDPDSPSMVQASQWGKDKLESNTAFVIYKFIDLSDDTTTKELVAEMEIHTSCSKPLFIGQTVSNNGYSLEVNDGLAGNDPAMTSIPIADSLTCEDKKSKSIGSITVKKALTNDNGGTAVVGDFTITVTNVETNDPFDLVPTGVPSVSTRDVPAGTYTISETVLDGYTTVLIAGDTGCPSMVDEVFIIKKGKDLSCIIYNDDNGDGTSGGDGIFFVRNSISFDPRTSGTCTMVADVINNSPCIRVNGPTLFIADPTLDDPTKAPTAIITSTIIQITTGLLSPPGCIFLGVNEMYGVVGFGMDCSGIQTDGRSTYNANYAIIDASP